MGSNPQPFNALEKLKTKTQRLWGFEPTTFQCLGEKIFKNKIEEAVGVRTHDPSANLRGKPSRKSKV